MAGEYIYGTIKVCPVCEKEFQQRDADTENRKAVYCSYACNNRSRTIHKMRYCQNCSQEFKPRRSGQKFCSRGCAGNFKSNNHVQQTDVISNGKLAIFCCGLISRCLRNKTDKTKDMLGYSVKDLKEHLESLFKEGMNWENYGNKVGNWSIDHIRPISSFTTEDSVAEINALSNLQPMWHSQNCSKGNKWKDL